MIISIKVNKSVVINVFYFVIYLYFSPANCSLQYEPLNWKLISFLNDSRYSLVLIFVLYCTYFSKMIKLSSIIVIYLYIVCYNYTYIYEYTHSFKKLNNTLLNGFLLVHPPLLYVTYVYIYKIIFYKTNFIIKNYNQLKNKNCFILCSSMCALLLGSWWAQQELNWGGWWNWDPIEMIAFVMFYLSLLYTHNNFSLNSINLRIATYVKVTFLLIYVITRFDILNSIHSFAISSNSELLFELRVVIFYVLIYLFYKFTLDKYKYKNIFFILSFLLVFFFFNILIFFSIININLNQINIQKLYMITSILILHRLYNYNKKSLYLGFLLSNLFLMDYFFIVILLFYFIIQIKPKTVKNTHLTIIVIIIIMYLYSKITFFTIKIPSKLYNYLSCNYSWLYKTYNLEFAYSYNKNYTQEIQPLSNLTSFYKNFFFQKIYNDCKTNYSFINNINIIFFLEKFLFIYVLLFVATLIGILIFFKKKSLKSGIV